MALVEIDANTRVDTESLAKIAFVADESHPLAERAELYGTGTSVLTLLHTASSIPTLQKLREVVGDGTGGTGWVRIREPGGMDDNADMYANLRAVGRVEFGSARDGEIAQVRIAASGPVIGEVHLPDAVGTLRQNPPTRPPCNRPARDAPLRGF